MGIYLNPSNELFIFSANSVPYVDKSGIIAVLNRMIHTDDRYVCVSRPRRFGKTMTANMLSAYYNREYDALELFERLNIAGDDSFKKHLNRYDVIFLDISDLYSKSAVGEMIVTIENMLIRDLMKAYPDIPRNDLSFIDYLKEVHATTGTGFIIIIDEWDCVFREKEESGAAREEYLEFLRKFLKDKSYVSLVYMTGILPIKKYISDSALNMFQEFSMSDPSVFAEFTGFTGEEVNALCDTYSMDFGEMAVWYDGYRFPSVPSVYNPRSVVLAIKRRKYSSYWTKTVSFEALQIYIGMNFDGLRESVVSLLAGNKVKVKTDTFSNDMVTFQRKDDIL
ncbi:MAG: AAA family ATPase, partial [Fusobacteriaceae bacterium]|nr:AAA family ATPase [Fusobacteriaceae bacterium]